MKKNVSDLEFEQALSNIDNKKIINSVLKKYNKQIPNDELRRCGQVGLLKALAGHDFNHPSKQKFTTSLCTFVNWECLWVLRSQTFRKNKPSISLSCISPSLLANSYSQDSDTIDFNEFLDSLCPISAQIAKMVAYENMKIKDIAKAIGKSKAYVRSILKGIGSRLKV